MNIGSMDSISDGGGGFGNEVVEARDLLPVRKRRPRVTLREASGEF